MPARVVLLAGPSGSGKSRLARRSGLPVLPLDDFYKDGDDPTLPRLSSGLVDWDDPASWSLHAAVEALHRLCTAGHTSVPVYDISANAAGARREILLGDADLVVAEGIFAAEVIAPAVERGLLSAAICVRRFRWLTMVLRFLRDVREHRKPLPVLLRRGWYLARQEASIVAALQAKGCVCRTPRQVERMLRRPSVGAMRSVSG